MFKEIIQNMALREYLEEHLGMSAAGSDEVDCMAGAGTPGGGGGQHLGHIGVAAQQGVASGQSSPYYDPRAADPAYAQKMQQQQQLNGQHHAPLSPKSAAAAAAVGIHGGKGGGDMMGPGPGAAAAAAYLTPSNGIQGGGGVAAGKYGHGGYNGGAAAGGRQAAGQITDERGQHMRKDKKECAIM